MLDGQGSIYCSIVEAADIYICELRQSRHWFCAKRFRDCPPLPWSAWEFWRLVTKCIISYDYLTALCVALYALGTCISLVGTGFLLGVSIIMIIYVQI